MPNKQPNKPKTWKVVIEETGEVIRYYRTKGAAVNDLLGIQELYDKKLVIWRNHEDE